MKTSTELTTDLNAAEKRWGHTMLVVAHPKGIRAVSTVFPERERLQQLERLLRQGGIPIGMVATPEPTDGKRYFKYCVLEEHIADGWAQSYLKGFVEWLAKPLPKPVFLESVGVDEFRSEGSEPPLLQRN